MGYWWASSLSRVRHTVGPRVQPLAVATDARGEEAFRPGRIDACRRQQLARLKLAAQQVHRSPQLQFQRLWRTGEQHCDALFSHPRVCRRPKARCPKEGASRIAAQLLVGALRHKLAERWGIPAYREDNRTRISARLCARVCLRAQSSLWLLLKDPSLRRIEQVFHDVAAQALQVHAHLLRHGRAIAEWPLHRRKCTAPIEPANPQQPAHRPEKARTVRRRIHSFAQLCLREEPRGAGHARGRDVHLGPLDELTEMLRAGDTATCICGS